jgi:AcrR family transcriptional regulator
MTAKETPVESPFAPRQARSRATAERLLLATAQIIEAKGLDGALIPAIAAAAKVAPASVYRRFADKEDLLRTVFLWLLHNGLHGNPERVREMILRETLAKTARRIVHMSFEQYRQNPGLIRALVRFLETDTNTRFVEEARAILSSNIEFVVDVLLSHRHEFGGGITRKDVRFAVFNCGCSVYMYMLDPHSLWHSAQSPFTEAELARMLTRNLVAFLAGNRAAGPPSSAAG